MRVNNYISFFRQTVDLRQEEAKHFILPLLGGFSNVFSVFGVYDRWFTGKEACRRSVSYHVIIIRVASESMLGEWVACQWSLVILNYLEMQNSVLAWHSIKVSLMRGLAWQNILWIKDCRALTVIGFSARYQNFHWFLICLWQWKKQGVIRQVCFADIIVHSNGNGLLTPDCFAET